MLSQPENLLAPDDGMTLFDPVHPMVKLNDLQDTDCMKKNNGVCLFLTMNLRCPVVSVRQSENDHIPIPKIHKCLASA